MPAVITFWQLPEEEDVLLRYIAGTGDIVACNSEWVSDPTLLTPRPLLEAVEAYDLDRVAIAPREVMAESRIDRCEYEGSLWYSQSYLISSVISYSRPRFRSPRELGLSNMCAQWDYWDTVDGEDTLIRKPEAFIKWAQKVFRWVRRFTPRWHQYKGYRVTEKVADEIARGLEIVP